MNPNPLVALNHFTVPLAITSSPREQKNKKRTPGPRKPACPTDAGYAVWGALDSLNDSGISAENDRYRSPFAAFCLFRDDWELQTPGNGPDLAVSELAGTGHAARAVGDEFLQFSGKISTRSTHGRVAAEARRCRIAGRQCRFADLQCGLSSELA